MMKFTPSQQTAAEIAREREAVRARYYPAKRAPLKGEELRARRAETALERAERERRVEARMEERKHLNKLRHAPASQYDPANEVPQKALEKISKPKPKVDYQEVKERREAKKAALAAYDAKWGTSFARPAPLTRKLTDTKDSMDLFGIKNDNNAILVSWNDVVSKVLTKHPEETMKSKINMAAAIWKGMKSVYLRPDVKIKAEKAESRRPLSEEAKKRRDDAAEKLRKRAAYKRSLLKQDPEKFAEVVAFEKYAKKVEDEKRAIRRAASRLGGIGAVEKPLRYAVEGDHTFLATRAEFTKIFGRDKAPMEWATARRYEYAREPAIAVAKAMRKRPLKELYGVPVRGKGIYTNPISEEERLELSAKYGVPIKSENERFFLPEPITR